MPVTLSARAIGDALARVQEHDIDAQSALGWLARSPRAMSDFLLRAEPIGIVAWRERRLTAAGRGALHHGLRARALGPATTVAR